MFHSAWYSRGLGLLLGIAAPVRPAFSGERQLTAHLDWTAPTTQRCPTAAGTVRAVETRLNRTVFVQDSQADLFLTVALESKGATWLAKLTLLDADRKTLGTRELESNSHDCAALSDVLPVVIALLVDASQRDIRLDLPEPSYSPPVAKPLVLPSRPATLMSSHQPQASPMRLGWRVQGEGFYGLLPEIAPGASVVGFVDPARRNLTLELWLGALSSTKSNAEVRFSLIHAGAGLCPNLWQHTVRGAICGGIDAGRLQSLGQGFDVNQSNTTLHVDLRAMIKIDVPIVRPWFAHLGAGVLFPMIRQQFVGEVTPQARTTLHRPALVVPVLMIGVGAGSE